MKAVVYEDVRTLRVADVADPVIEDPADAIVRVTAAAICGSDLHFFSGKAPLTRGDTIGHEGMGIVEEVGPDVTSVQPGDRVVIAFDIVCGDCWFCRNGQTGLCEDFRALGTGMVGGSLHGTQAEYVRVPKADVNLLKVPEGLEDERALFVGDVLTTAYYGAAIAGISDGDTVAVIGAGPVGFFCAQTANLHGAARVLVLDSLPDRLALAEKVGGFAVNISERNPETAVYEETDGRGADVVLEAVGSAPAYQTSTRIVRRGGTVCVIGMYVGERVEVPLGIYWTRGFTIRFAGICPVHAWWERAMQAVVDGAIDPLPLISHTLSLEDAVRGYELFDAKEATKVVLKP